MNIDIKREKNLNKEVLGNLYQDAEWSAYTNDLEKLHQAVLQSYEVLTAWEGQKLVGLLRTVSDGLTIVYIQDILVLKSHQNQGIGSQLMQMILEMNKNVRQKVLLTGEAPDVRHFYEKNGLDSCDKGNAVAFTLLD